MCNLYKCSIYSYSRFLDLRLHTNLMTSHKICMFSKIVSRLLPTADFQTWQSSSKRDAIHSLLLPIRAVVTVVKTTCQYHSTQCLNVTLMLIHNLFSLITQFLTFQVILTEVHSLEATAVAQWLRCCATNRKVAGSIPDGVTGIFHWHNPSDRTMALGSTQPLIEMSA